MMKQVYTAGCGNPQCKWNTTPREFWVESVGPDVWVNAPYTCTCGMALVPSTPPQTNPGEGTDPVPANPTDPPPSP